MPVLVPISAQVFVVLLLVGSALLAGWALVRFENVGPRTLGGALLAKGAALVILVGFPWIVADLALHDHDASHGSNTKSLAVLFLLNLRN